MQWRGRIYSPSFSTDSLVYFNLAWILKEYILNKFGKTLWIVDRPTGNRSTWNSRIEGRSQTRFPGSLVFQISKKKKWSWPTSKYCLEAQREPLKYEAWWAASGSGIWTRCLQSRRRGANHSDNTLSLRIQTVLPAVQVARRAGLSRQKRILPPSCLSLSPHVSAPLPLDGFFLWNLFARGLRVERAWYKAQVKIKLCLLLSRQGGEQTLEAGGGIPDFFSPPGFPQNF